MIKALILVHLWSLVVAVSAWGLQRDGTERIGARFPAPTVWLLLILLCLLPGAFYLIPFDKFISIPTTEALEIFSIQAVQLTTGGTASINFAAIYIGLVIVLMGATLWRWLQLQGLPLAPTAQPDVFTTSAALPPLTLSWPRRAVVVPEKVEARAALLRHERAHLHHYDAELTLLLLLLQDIMLRNPGIGFLVRQWRLAIELRADRLATKDLTIPERKDYAALLLNIQRPGTERGGTLPCPTARLGSTHHRSTKMRLVDIIEGQPAAKKWRWGTAIFLSTFGASALGLTSAVATINAGIVDMQSSPIVYAQKVSTQLPDRCPGLKVDGANVEVRELFVDGELVPQQTLLLGTVILNHDARRDGTVYNPRTIGSTHPCFEDNAKTALSQWKAEPQEFEIRNAVVKVNFGVSGDTIEDIKVQLDSFFE